MTPRVSVDWSKPLLQVRNLRKFFPITAGMFHKTVGQVRAVDDVTFDVHEGETLGLVGESGCGKTTTSRCILRSHRAYIGANTAPTHARGDRRSRDHVAGAVAATARRNPDDFPGSLRLSRSEDDVVDNVGEPLLVNGMSNRNERMDRVAELLRLVGLRAEFMHRFPHAFSGGQRQRIGIARALSTNPRLVVADEPVSALDVSVQAQVLNLLLELQKRLHLTFLFVAHDLSVVRHISDRVAVMYVGQLVELASTRTLSSRPRHPYTAALMRAVPVPDPRIPMGEATLKGEVPSPAKSSQRLLSSIRAAASPRSAAGKRPLPCASRSPGIRALPFRGPA